VWDHTVNAAGDHDFCIDMSDVAVLVHSCATDDNRISNPKCSRAWDLGPDPLASRDHAVFERNDEGIIMRYQTWIENDQAPSGRQKGRGFGVRGPSFGNAAPIVLSDGGRAGGFRVRRCREIFP
jgi:hypothetical protein